MPRVRALTPAEAKKTFANRFGPTADRLRQFATKFGVRPYRCFLTWTKWVGGTADDAERGEGVEVIVARAEILPTPRVVSLDNLALSPFHAGVLPVGSVRVDRISLATFTEDSLLGKAVPSNAFLQDGQTPVDASALPFGEKPGEKHIPEPFEFFWEIVEDGRGDDPAKRARFRPLNRPFRRAGKVDYSIMLERTSEDRTRDDKSAIGTGLE